MAERQPPTTGRGIGDASLVLSGVLFLAFVIDVLSDKARAIFGWSLPFGLSDVGEFLALLSAAYFFTVSTLLREHQNRSANPPSDRDRPFNEP